MRKAKLLKSASYRKSEKAQLVKWLGAKYLTTELVANISAAETMTRCLLTWQEFDHSLWLATCSTEQSLAESLRVSKPKDFIAARPQMVIGFSDQVPLWAKSTGKRAVFSEEEVHESETVKDFSGIRQAISDVMNLDGAAEMMISPFQPATTAKDPVAKQLSFSDAEEDDPKQAEQLVPASPKPTPKSLPGSRTLIEISGDDRFRITFEARQLLFGVYGSPEEPI